MEATLGKAQDLRAKREEDGLWRRFEASRDRHARERLFELYLPLARRMAGRYAGVSEPYDDLVQVAGLGLLNAIDRFDPTRGTSFAAFAKPTILGELKRYFRDKVWTVRVPRSIHDRMPRVEKATEKLTLDLQRPPSTRELAAEVGISTEDLLEVLEARGNRRPLSLDVSIGEEGDQGPGEEWVGRPDGNFELIDDLLAVSSALPVLDAREREVLRLRFIEELPQSEIALRVGCSQMHVSRLLRRSLQRLRDETSLEETDGGTKSS